MNFAKIEKRTLNRIVCHILIILPLLLFIILFDNISDTNRFKIIYLQHNWSLVLRIDFVLYAISIGVLFIIAIYSDKVSISIKVMAVVLCPLLINLLITRPLGGGLYTRIIADSIPLVNPFLAKSFSIDDVCAYPSKHIDFARKGYFNADVKPHARRLTTYPPGLPVCYNIMEKLIYFLRIDVFLDPIIRRVMDSESYFANQTEKRQLYFSLVDVCLYLFCFSSSIILCFILSFIVSNSLYASVYSASLFSLVPSLYAYSNTTDILFIPISILIGIVVILSVTYRSNYLYILSGILLYIGVFLSFAFLLHLFLWSIFICIYKNNRNIKSVLYSVLFFYSGFICPTILGYVLLKYNPLEMYLVASRNNNCFYLFSDRTYGYSLVCNIIEISVFTGFVILPEVIIYAKNTISTIKNMLNCRSISMTEAYLLSVVITLIILFLSGAVRGEVSRNLMLLIPFVVIGVAIDNNFTKKRYLIISLILLICSVTLSSICETTFGIWQTS